jgi:hypothetical protein
MARKGEVDAGAAPSVVVRGFRWRRCAGEGRNAVSVPTAWDTAGLSYEKQKPQGTSRPTPRANRPAPRGSLEEASQQRPRLAGQPPRLCRQPPPRAPSAVPAPEGPSSYNVRRLRRKSSPGTWEGRRLSARHYWGVEGDRNLRYMMPIVLGSPVCLGSHGGPQDIAPEVRDELRCLYPDDKATGYRIGDLRGAVSVKIPQGSGPH